MRKYKERKTITLQLSLECIATLRREVGRRLMTEADPTFTFTLADLIEELAEKIGGVCVCEGVHS